MAEHLKPARWPVLLGAIALVYLVVALFFPILGFQFVDLDVRWEVIENPHVHGLTGQNLKHIFTSWCIHSYYPVRTFTYAVDYQLWGLNPTGFKLTGGLIHLGNVLLVFWLMLRLFRHPAAAHRSPGAWWEAFVAAFSAGVFAVHPVVVEPVVWVAGREELLMTLGALGCIHFHLSARRLSQDGGKTRRALVCHLAAAFCCAMACLSNAVGAVIPLLITAWDLLTLAPPKFRKILFGTSALWVIGAATMVIKKLGPVSSPDMGTPGPLSAERLMLALNTYRLNLKTLLWPKGLALSYDWRIPKSFLDVEVILGALAIALTGVVLWKLRRRKLMLFGLVWFGLALGPTSQIMPHHVPRADRFLYLPLVGLALAVAVGLRPLAQALKHWAALPAAIAVAVMGLLVPGILSARQVQTWQDSIHVWENCVNVDPNNYFAHCQLADNLVAAGQFDRAFEEYKLGLRLDVENLEALSDLALMLATCDDQRRRNYDLAVLLAELACRCSQWKDPKVLRQSAIVHCAAADELQVRGEFERAIQTYRMAIDADADYDVPLFKLAVLLTTCPDVRLREADTAVALAERALKLTDHPDAHQLAVLAAAYAEARRFEQAVAAITQAISLAEVAGNSELTAELRRQLTLYQNGIPFHY